MLILTILVILPFIRHGSSINLTYILKKQNKKLEPSCLAQDSERYRGVGWVYPIPENESQIPRITTKFIPEIKNDYNCDFSKNNDCNLNWSMRDWELDEDSLKTYNFLGDERWEDLPTIFTSKNSKDFNVQVPNAFRLGFSVRSGNPVDFQICAGWNPKNYPCFYVHADKMKARLEKHNGATSTKDFKPLDSYTAFRKIISDDEWRNFVISYNDIGEFNLFDVNLNRTILTHKEADNLRPLYFIPNSEQPALWKIHQNHFLYTKKPNTYRLGKPISISSKDMCISLHVSTCDGCEMRFFTINSDKSQHLLYQAHSTGELQWNAIKLKQQNVGPSQTIFVQTVFKKGSKENLGFWAIDDVRFCHENEVKVSYLDNVDMLNLKNKDDEDFISCQIISQPEWRPKKLSYDNVKDFPNIIPSQTKNSISLKWNDEDPNHQTSYFISYQGNDICEQAPHNLRRIKSNGFVSTNYNKFVLENLEPYTKYNIVISSVLHEMDKRLEVTTLEEDTIQFSEFPRVKLQANDTYVALSWEPVDCQKVYGHVMYSLTVSNTTQNFLKELKLQTEYAYQINGLKPFTQYKLNIKMGRKPEDLEHSNATVFEQNFTTLAGAAASVQNLEVYAIGKNKAFLRYELPNEMRGIPSNLKVNKCNALSFKKCKQIFKQVEHCPIWPDKYCITIDSLPEHQEYTFGVSLKNYNTVTYGKEVSVTGYTIEKVPGPPTNITYQIVDCQNGTDFCNINVSWLHPYQQNGTITSFAIKMNGTNELSKTNEHERISEVYKVMNDEYLPKYTYQIKYIPYGIKYDLSVQSLNNAFKSDMARTSFSIDLGDHIDQSPTLVAKCDNTVVFNLPELDRRLDHYKVTVAVQEEKEVEVNDDLPDKVVDNLCWDFGKAWIAKEIKVTDNTTRTITIGQADESDKASKVTNKPLNANTNYCFVFIITNNYRNSEHDVVYIENAFTASCVKEAAVQPNSSHKSTYALLLLLLMIPVGFLVYWYIKRRRRANTAKENPDNVYESLPFEECEDNSVNNLTYDKLLHK